MSQSATRNGYRHPELLVWVAAGSWEVACCKLRLPPNVLQLLQRRGAYCRLSVEASS